MDLMKTLFKVGDEKEFLKKYWVYDKDYYPHWDEVKIAEKKYEYIEDNQLLKVEFYVTAMPATFLTLVCYLEGGNNYKINTGSGNIVEFLEMFMPILDMWGTATMGLRPI